MQQQDSDEPPTAEEMQQMCGCKSQLKDMVDQMEPLMQALCSACGKASSAAVLNQKCALKDTHNNATLNPATACSSLCQPLICDMVTACPAAATLPGLPATVAADIKRETAKAEGLLAEKGCPCSASALEVRTEEQSVAGSTM